MRNELDLAGRLRSFADAIELGDHTIPGDIDVRREAFSGAAARSKSDHAEHNR